jgi:hypothetical protein
MRRGALVVDQPGGTILRPCRTIDRLAARLLGARLDRELAAGRAPEWSAARAEHIVSLPFRQTLADDWDQLLRPRRRQPRLLRRERVAAAEPAIRLLTEQLRAPLPVPARGVALASVLITDGCGPLYNPSVKAGLEEPVLQAVAFLDAASPLSW